MRSSRLASLRRCQGDFEVVPDFEGHWLRERCMVRESAPVSIEAIQAGLYFRQWFLNWYQSLFIVYKKFNVLVFETSPFNSGSFG